MRLALRNPLNVEDVLTRGATVGGLLASYQPKVVSKAKEEEAFSRDQVEVIKGGTILKGKRGRS